MNPDDDTGRSAGQHADSPAETPSPDSGPDPRIGIDTIMSIDPDEFSRVMAELARLLPRLQELKMRRATVTAELGNAVQPPDQARAMIRLRPLLDDLAALRGELLTLRTAAQGAMPLPRSREAFLAMFHRMDESVRTMAEDVAQALNILHERGITEDMA